LSRRNASRLATAAGCGGSVSDKKYDPLWEIIDEKVPLQGAEPDVDSICPYCNVNVHLGPDLKLGERVECGLCGSISEVSAKAGKLALKPVPEEE
jgi:hypothetical protein